MILNHRQIAGGLIYGSMFQQISFRGLPIFIFTGKFIEIIFKESNT